MTRQEPEEARRSAESHSAEERLQPHEVREAEIVAAALGSARIEDFDDGSPVAGAPLPGGSGPSELERRELERRELERRELERRELERRELEPRELGPGQLGGDGAAEAEIAELRALAAAWRSALLDVNGPVDDAVNGAGSGVRRGTGRDSDAFQAARVAQRVLERTTREDLRRRADLGLMVDFVSDRLRESALLRVAAALLLVQLTIVPLVAYHLLRERPPAWLNVDFDEVDPELVRELEDDLPEPPLDVVGGSATGVEDALVGRVIDQELDANASLLAEIESRTAGAVAPSTRVGSALHAMTGLGALGHGSLAGSLAGTPAGERAQAATAALAAIVPSEGGDRAENDNTRLLGAALAAEARLFAVHHGLEWRGIATELERLVVLLADGEGLDEFGRALAGRAVAHALRAGVALPARAESLDGNMGRPLSHDDPRLATARGTVWIETLVSALRRSGAAAADPYVATWISAADRAR